MKAIYPILLALSAFATAAPRITQISPATGRIDGEPIARDIDNDGDLDLVYLARGTSSNTPSHSSTWLENLGGRKFSAPRSLGSFFRSRRRYTNQEALISPQDSNETFLIATVSNLVNNSTELYLKELSSSEWDFLKSFASGTSIILPSPQDVNFPGFLSYDQTSPEVVAVWQFSNLGKPFLIGDLTIPPAINSQISNPSHLQSADLDLDGDFDLIFQSQNTTLLYERLDSGTFSSEPTVIAMTDALVGDLNQDQLPDFINSSQLRATILNEGNFQFTAPLNRGPNLGAQSVTFGRFDQKPSLFCYIQSGISIQLKVYQFDLDLNFSLAKTTTLTPLNPTSPLAADFDGDDQTEVSLVSRTTPFRSSIDIFDRVEIPGIPRSNSDFISFGVQNPNYDRVVIAWSTQQATLDFVPANSEDPIMCHSPAVGDFNNDGTLDLIVGPDSKGNSRIMLNDGHGGFDTSRILSELIPPEINRDTFHLQDFVPVDINGDGFLDLSFSLLEPEVRFLNGSLETLAVCAIALGNGDGSFEQPSFVPGTFDNVTTSFCGIRSFHDWDNDGDLDATLAGAWRENIDGALREGVYPLIQNEPSTDALGNPSSSPAQHISDIDGDGFLDVLIPAMTSTVVPSQTQGIPGINFFPFNYTAGVAFTNAFGSISEISDRSARLMVTDALGNPVTLPFIALDLDLDGRRELLIAKPVTDALGNPVVLGIEKWKLDAENPRDLSLAQAITIPAFSIPWSDQLVDFNGDGELEYAASDQYITPTLRGPLVSPKYHFRGDLLGTTSLPLATVAVADFDNDGDLDSLYAQGFSGLYLVRNTLVDEDSPITAALVEAGLTPSRATPQLDADGDGRSNALEFLQGTDPLVADLAPSDFLKTNLSADGKRLTFYQPSNSVDFALYFDLEISEDLENWSRIAPSSVTIESTDENSQKVSVEIPRMKASSYYRISATHDPRRP